MARDIFQTTIVMESGGALVPLSGVQVYVHPPGTTVTNSTIYGSRTGGTISNPITTGANGFVEFYAEPGMYDVRVVDTNNPKRIADKTFLWNSVPGDDIPNDQLLSIDYSVLSSVVKDMMWHTGDVRATAIAVSSGSEPTGWLLCDGRAVSRSTYSTLYTALGGASSPYGLGDGSTTFNLPDYQGRTLVGRGTHADVNALTDNDGTAVGNRSPKHRHSPHSHTIVAPYQDPQGDAGFTQNSRFVGGGALGDASGHLVTDNAEVGPAGTPLDGPAYAVVNYLIKT